jgi:hypothetical protein
MPGYGEVPIHDLERSFEVHFFVDRTGRLAARISNGDGISHVLHVGIDVWAQFSPSMRRDQDVKR